MKRSDLVLRILQLAPKISRTRLAKLAYLFDLACVQLYGKQASDIPYKWHKHGPYCDEIEEATWDLQERKLISVEAHQTQEGNDCFLHYALTDRSPRIDKELDALLVSVVKRFAGRPLKDLLRFVYDTPPMKQAQSGPRFRALDMTAKGDPGDLLDPKVARMLLESERTPREDYVPMRSVRDRLRAVPLPSKR